MSKSSALPLALIVEDDPDCDCDPTAAADDDVDNLFFVLFSLSDDTFFLDCCCTVTVVDCTFAAVFVTGAVTATAATEGGTAFNLEDAVGAVTDRFALGAAVVAAAAAADGGFAACRKVDAERDEVEQILEDSVAAMSFFTAAVLGLLASTSGISAEGCIFRFCC
jgi:hypothetical protein